jgi:6-phosphogluconolactonase
MILLGIGEDGHTASLFPNDPGVHETESLAVASRGGAGGLSRVTLSLPTINQASGITFLVSGREKAAIVQEVLERERGVHTLPAALVQPVNGELVFLLDRSAASLLTSGSAQSSPPTSLLRSQECL